MISGEKLSYRFKLFIEKILVSPNTTSYLLLFLLAIINFYPLFFGGFTTHDDAAMAINGWSGHTWEWAKSASVAQGRFVFHWGFPFSGLPFVVDNRIWYLFIKYGSFFLLLFAMYYGVSKLFRSTWIALASVVFFLSIIQNGWEHNAVTSYAFIFNAYASIFLLSLGLFATALDHKNYVLAVFSGVLYFFSLGTELFVLFLPLYFSVVLSRMAPNDSVLNGLKLYKKYILAIVFSLVLYLTMYIAWRLIYPSSYDGNSLTAFNVFSAIRVIWTYGINAFPLSSVHRYISHSNTDWFFNYSGENIAIPIKPMVVGVLFARLMYVVPFSVPPARTILVGAVLAGAAIFLPNVLLGFTERHQSWVAMGTNTYVYTYYSFIAAVIFCSLLLSYVNIISQSWNFWKKLFLVIVVVVLMMIVSFLVEVSNQQYAFYQKLSHRRWQLMDAVIKSPFFMEIKDGSTIFAPTLITSNRNIEAVLAEDWSNYVKYKTGKIVLFSDKDCISEIQCYTLVFRQELYSDNQYVVLAAVNQANLQSASELVIFSNRPQPRAVVTGSLIPGKVAPDLKINGKPIKNVGAGLFSAFLPDSTNKGFAEIAHITSNIPMIPERITLSNYGVEPRLRSFTEQMADGIDFTQPDYPEFLKEVLGVSGPEAFGRWTDATDHPSAEFRFKEVLPRKFTLEVSAGAFGPNMGSLVKVRIGDVVKEYICTPELLHDPIRLGFETDGTADTIIITPFKPTSPNEIDPKNTDRRKLGISLLSLKIKIDPS